VDDEDQIWFLSADDEETAPDAQGTLGRLNLETGEVQEYPVPAGEGGAASLSMDLVRKTAWVNYFGAAKLSGFDLGGELWKEFEQASEKSSSRSEAQRSRPGLTVDSEGKVWSVPGGGGQRVMRFDPVKEEVRVYEAPSEWLTAGSEEQAVLGGITADSSDNIWLTLPWAQSIARLEPGSGAFEKYLVPCNDGAGEKGAIPTQLTSDSRGRIWTHDAGCQSIWMFDPESREFKQFPLPKALGQLSLKLHMDRWDGLWLTGRQQAKVAMLNTADY
jgi:streptogramin lyase